MANSARVWAVALSLLCLTTPLVAQTTGRIQGTVTDNSGAAIPGVAVSVSSSSLQGVHSTITDNKGEFRFASVPPGSYSVKLELAGFKTVNQSGVVVGIDRTVSLPFKLEVAALSETVSVTGESPVIDTSSSSTGVNATADLFNRLPVQRDIYAIATRGAGHAGRRRRNRRSTARRGAENNYIIEGLNTTGIRSATQGKTLNFDFVEEIEVKTGGLPAEYGRMTGGVLNVLTKSGGNNVQGRRLRLLRRRRPAERRLHRDPAARHDHDGHRHRQPVRLRRRPRWLPRQGQAVVLRRLQPHEPHRQLHGDPHHQLDAGQPRRSAR